MHASEAMQTLEKESPTYEDYARLPEGAPDLIVEILSPSTAYYDLEYKNRLYEAAGVKECWIVDSMEKSIDVITNGEDGFTLCANAESSGAVASPLLVGFGVELNTIF